MTYLELAKEKLESLRKEQEYTKQVLLKGGLAAWEAREYSELYDSYNGQISSAERMVCVNQLL